MLIVCGTDFSPQASQAVRAAVAIAKQTQSRIALVHAVQHGPSEVMWDEPAVLDSVEARLGEEAHSLRSEGIEVREVVLRGFADEAILEFVERESADLVVVSSLGHRSRLHWRLGSTAERLCETTHVPVLVVRDAKPFEEWAARSRNLRIQLCADFGSTSKAAAEWVMSLQKSGPCDASVVHIYWPPEERARLGVRNAVELIGREGIVEQVLLRDLEARFAELSEINPRFRVIMSFGRPADHLINAAEQEHMDVMVVGTHRRRALGRIWHGSVSHGVVHNSAGNVVCVPTPETQTWTPVDAMPQLRSVLVATDLSHLGNSAIAYACSILPSGGTCHILHVIESGAGESVPEEAKSGATVERESLQMAPILTSLAPEQAAARGIAIRPHAVRNRAIATTICQTAERLGVDQIVLASHGRSGISQLFAGSVAQDVLRRSRKPVLIVPASRDE